MRRLSLLPVVVALLTGATTVAQNRTISVTSQGSGRAILSPERDASANWQMAGLLSVGGIPNRTTICATVAPLGSGQDDTANIQNAVNKCPLDRRSFSRPGPSPSLKAAMCSLTGGSPCAAQEPASRYCSAAMVRI